MEMKLDYSDISFQNNGKLKLLIIVGTRPEIIRLAAVINKCRKYFDCILAHTGQNYDYNLNGIFFRDLGLADPDVYMNAVGDDLGATVGNIINCSYIRWLATTFWIKTSIFKFDFYLSIFFNYINNSCFHFSSICVFIIHIFLQ